MARVTIEDAALHDPRFVLLGKLLGSNKHDALGRMIPVWSYCTARCLHSLSGEVLEVLGETKDFQHMLVKCNLAELENKEFRICGTSGRIEWLDKIKTKNKKAGKARSLNAERNQDGTFVSSDPAKIQPEISLDSSCSSSALTLTLTPTLINKTHTSNKEFDPPAQHTQPREKKKEDILDEIVQLWNTHCGSLPKVERLTTKRKRGIQARLVENPDLNYWERIIRRIAESSFCNGGGSTGWRASFDFLLQPDTSVKVSEGKYDDKNKVSASKQILNIQEKLTKAEELQKKHNETVSNFILEKSGEVLTHE